MPENSLLASLPRVAGQPCFHWLDDVALAFGQVLLNQDRHIGYVYFPTTCLVSLVAAGGIEVEVAVIGRDGMVGVSVALGNDLSAASAVVQVPGQALRSTAANFLAALGRPQRRVAAVQRYSDDLAAQVVRTASCIRNHRPEQRLARWLLMMHDRLPKSRYTLTQEHLGRMLGVRRAEISDAARRLRRRQLIRYGRGIIEITNAAGLERVSCDCYLRWPR
jgi:CRP-like cAMP-binding protein